MNKMNKKGFTLIEILAVIVILGLLMAIAIPSVTKYITQSRKKTLVVSINSFSSAATVDVNSRRYGSLSKQNVIFYIPVSDDQAKSCVTLDKGGSDPFGDWKEAYVAVTYSEKNNSYEYYFTFYDDAGYGMALTNIKDISSSGDGQIVNPSPVNADTITKQLAGFAKESKVLVAPACDTKTAVSGGVINNGTDNGNNNGTDNGNNNGTDNGNNNGTDNGNNNGTDNGDNNENVVTPTKKVEYIDKFPVGGYCAQGIDEFYTKNGTTYYFTCKMSQYIYVRVNGVEYGLVEALESGIVTIEEVEAARGSKFPSKSIDVSKS